MIRVLPERRRNNRRMWAIPEGFNAENHMSRDSRIGWAFEGKKGGASEIADPPPMSRDEFVAAFGSWHKDGAACEGPWYGTIKMEYSRSREVEGKADSLYSSHEHIEEEGHATVEFQGANVHVQEGMTMLHTSTWQSTVKGGKECGDRITGASSTRKKKGVVDVNLPSEQSGFFGASRADTTSNITGLGDEIDARFRVSVFLPFGQVKEDVHATTSASGGCLPPAQKDTAWTRTKEEFTVGPLANELLDADENHPEQVDGQLIKAEDPKSGNGKLKVTFKLEKR